MLLSVIVPIYNASKTIRNCIDSIVNQTLIFSNYEVILINDGSTDKSQDICTEYTIKYNNVYLYNFENSGVAVSRRRGVDRAKGDYVLFVDSDDSINNQLLENIANTVTANPDLDIIRYQSILHNDNPNKNHNRYNFYNNIGEIVNGIDALKLWSKPNIKYAVYWLFAFKKSLFVNVGNIPDIRCYEDVAYIPLLIATAKKITTIEYAGYNYQCNRDGSLTNSALKSSQLNRAYDFYKACAFATKNFVKIKDVSKEDIEFFNKDYERRLRGFFYSMDIELQRELSELYHFLPKDN